MIYLDTSALLKLLHQERESDDLEGWLSTRRDTAVVSSEIAKVELIRSCRRVNADALPNARTLLAGLDLIPLTGEVVDAAAEVGDSLLRSLDAIHLASALSIRTDVSAFVAYDRRLADAASGSGLVSVQPGR